MAAKKKAVERPVKPKKSPKRTASKKKAPAPAQTIAAPPTHPEELPPSPAGPERGRGVVAQAPGGFGFANPRTSPDDFDAMTRTQIMADTKVKGSDKLQPIPKVRSTQPLSLDKVIGAAAVSRIKASGSITFHTVGDTGGIKEPSKQFAVADSMVSDLANKTYETLRPAFFYHLGDVVYYLGQERYYYEQFYDPYRDYDAPIFAIPGNHDGMVSAIPSLKETTLKGFLDNFCDKQPQHLHLAHGMTRSTMIQPGVYFTLNAPFVRFIGLYSNISEGATQGVISGRTVGPAQLKFLQAQLKQAAQDRTEKKDEPFALILAVHHPPFTGSKDHAPSPDMLKEIDAACDAAEIHPDLILSGHAHLYERYTRTRTDPWDKKKRQIPYVVAGMGGYFNLSGFKKAKIGQTIHKPIPPVNGQDADGNDLVLETYNDDTFGFLRITVSPTEIHATCLGVDLQKKQIQDGRPLDSFTINLASHTVTSP